VAVWRDEILIADTYNHQIKRVREGLDEVATLSGAAPLSLYEPGGLSVRGDTLYIADTNHDRIVEYDLTTGNWREFALSGLHTAAARMMDTTGVTITDAHFRQGSDLHVRLTARFPTGLHLNSDAPLFYTFLSADGDSPTTLEGAAKSLPAEFAIPSAVLHENGEYLLTLSLAYCTDSNRGLCVPVTLKWRVTLTGDSQSPNVLDLSARIAPL
jgi:hypothetical protein